MLSKDPEIENINKWLLSVMGKVAKREGDLNDATQPVKFRVVWGPDQICKRIVFDVDGNSTGFHERRKYEYTAPNHWVLEVWCQTPDKFTQGGENGTYEPFWVFMENDESYQRPTMKAVQFLIEMMRRGLDSNRTQSDVDDVSKEAYRKDSERILEEINNNIPYETHMVRAGSAVYNTLDKKGN